MIAATALRSLCGWRSGEGERCGRLVVGLQSCHGWLPGGGRGEAMREEITQGVKVQGRSSRG